jgi:hypothetical protein
MPKGVREPREGDHPQAEEVYEYVDIPEHLEKSDEQHEEEESE